MQHVCEKCSKNFSSPRSSQRFCSEDCRGYANANTDQQYSRIDGDLSYYLNRLLYKNNRTEGKSRKSITREQLMELWRKQDGLCAISGMPMTYRAKKGEKFRYNASIDCKFPISQGGRYEIDNIQLVCVMINSLVKDFPKEDFIRLCSAVAERRKR